MKEVKLCKFDDLQEKAPVHFLQSGLDLVVIRYGKNVSVLYGRCLHRGALMADGHIEGDNLICGLHGWDYRYDTGVSAYNNKEVLHKFHTNIKDGWVWIDEEEIVHRSGSTHHSGTPADRKGSENLRRCLV